MTNRPPIHWKILDAVARYYTLTRAQINKLHYPTDHDGRLTRKRLRLIHEAGLINRASMLVTNPLMGSPGYVYYPSAKGCDFLAQEKEDSSYKDICTRTPNWMQCTGRKFALTSASKLIRARTRPSATDVLGRRDGPRSRPRRSFPR